jgi:hypothetical protein
MNSLLLPAASPNNRRVAYGVLGLLVASAASVAIAALAMPASYSWQANSISESAAQGLQHAWIARLGFLCFGFAVLALTLAMRLVWARAAYWMHLTFAACMFGTAAFSHQPWLQGVPFDPFEDFLHSLTATGMGFAFSFGVLARLIQRNATETPQRAFDGLALTAATAMPLLAALYQSSGGLIQRAMFVVAYVWYGAEAFRMRRPGTSSQ